MNLNRLRLRPTETITHYAASFLSTDQHGCISGGKNGYFLQQTRFLSKFDIKAPGLSPVMATAVDVRSSMAIFLLTSPAGKAAGPPGGSHPNGGEIVEKGIEIRSTSSIGRALEFEINLTNHALSEARIVLDLAFEVDFADLNETTSGSDPQHAPVERLWRPGEDDTRGTLIINCRTPDLPHATHIRLESAGSITRQGEDIRFACTLPPRVAQSLRIKVVPVFLGTEQTDAGDERHRRARWDRACCTVEETDPIVRTVWDRASDDLFSLAILEGSGTERWVPVAGVPKYTALFGRDGLVASIQAALLSPTMLEGSLKLIGGWTAKSYDDRYDAQPGRVLHQRQLSPSALLGRNPFKHYYGDYSAPGWYVLGAALHYAHTADRGAFEAVRANVEATLAWMDRDGDIDGDGFYEYLTRAGKEGIKNQGWKDSGQAILYPDGSMVKDPIAMAEVQGLYFAAKQAIASAYMHLGEKGRASELLDQAAALKRRFNDRFWLPHKQYFALALDPDKNPVETIASDPAACLAYGIVDDDKAEAVAQRIMAADMFSGWGVRTLSADHPAYNPLAYHLGTIWPMSNAVVCYGLRRYGFDAASQIVAKSQIDASQLFEFDRLPEVFGGHLRDENNPHPGIYPGACSPQAWSASAVIQIVQTLLGLMPIAPLGTLIVDPALPDWLPALTMRNIQVGQHRVDLRFERRADGSTDVAPMRELDGLRLYRPSDAMRALPPGDRIRRMLADLGADAGFRTS